MSYQQAREHRTLGPKIALLAAVTADNGVPTDIVAALGTLTLTGIPVEDETVTIQGQVYRWRDTLALVNDVLIGANAAACVVNLVSAVNATAADSGTLWFAGIVANAVVSAVDGAGDTVVVTSLIPGTVGNAYTTTEASTNMSWGGATLASGVARETDAIEVVYNKKGQVRTYELTIEATSDDTIAFDALLYGDDSPTDLTADLGGFAPLGAGDTPGHVNDGTLFEFSGTFRRFRRIVTHLGNERFLYLEIDNSAGTNISVLAYLREVIERNV